MVSVIASSNKWEGMLLTQLMPMAIKQIALFMGVANWLKAVPLFMRIVWASVAVA